MSATATTSSSAYLRAAVLGGVAGLRTMLPVALLAIAAHRRAGERERERDAEAPLPWNILQARGTRVIGILGTIGEMIGDKLPFAPSRLSPAPLGGRIAMGAVAGGAVCQLEGRSPVVGAVVGALAAAGGSAAGYYARTIVSKNTPLPAVVGALAEDALALRIGTLALAPYLAT